MVHGKGTGVHRVRAVIFVDQHLQEGSARGVDGVLKVKSGDVQVAAGVGGGIRARARVVSSACHPQYNHGREDEVHLTW